MKKILAIAIALVMMMAISVPAFAAELENVGAIDPTTGETVDTAGLANGSLTVYNEEDGTYTAEDSDYVNIPVYGVLDSDGDDIPDTEEPGEVDTTIVYDFNIRWDSMEFVYSTTWNPSSLSYETKFNDSPQGGITVENRSNAAIAVDLEFTAESNFTGGLEFSLNDSGLEEELAGLTYTPNEVADDNGFVDPLKGVSSVVIAAAEAGTTDEETGESTGTAYDANFLAMVTEGSTMELGENVTRAQIGTITVTVSRVAEAIETTTDIAITNSNNDPSASFAFNVTANTELNLAISRGGKSYNAYLTDETTSVVLTSGDATLEADTDYTYTVDADTNAATLIILTTAYETLDLSVSVEASEAGDTVTRVFEATLTVVE